MLTVNQIIAQVQALANAHYQIAEVGVGTIAELQAKERSYPLLWVSHEAGSLQDNYKINNIRLTIFDRVITGQEGQDDSFMEQEVLSDTELILLDFLNYFHQNHTQDYVTTKTAPLEHFTERTNDRTAGWSTVLELRQFYDWNKCSIPESGATIDPSIDGLTLYDFCDQATIDRLTHTQIACLEAEFSQCDPVTVQVNSTTVGTPASGDTYNVTIQNSQLNAVGDNANPCTIGDSQMTVHSVNVDTVPAEQTYDFRVKDSAGTNIGTTANPSIVADTTIRNQANDWNDTEVAEGTYTLPYLRVVDSDGSNVDTIDYKPVADGAAFTCTPASYGTRILSLLRREYCVDALCGFSFRYIDDEWVGNAVCRIRRSSDNSEQDFTPTEITDGTLTTFTGAGDGHVVKFYDQTFNYFELFNNTAGNQAKLVTGGVLNTDTSGNPTCITTSTFGYEIGANGGNSSRLTLFSPSGAFWAVGTKNNSTSISRCISNAGNPAVGIADTTSFQNANGTGNPIAIVNGSTLANNQRDTLQAAINNVEHALLMHTCDWTASGNWRTGQGILAFQAYPIGSQISEFVLDKKDWSSATLVNLINSDLQTYYGYW